MTVSGEIALLPNRDRLQSRSLPAVVEVAISLRGTAFAVLSIRSFLLRRLVELFLSRLDLRSRCFPSALASRLAFFC